MDGALGEAAVMNRTSIVLFTFFVATLIGLMIYFGFISDWRLTSKSKWQANEASLGHLNDQLRDIAKKIQDLQGDNQCTGDSQCRIVGLGIKVCDYYKDFLVYSTKDAHEADLLRLVSDFNRIYAKFVAANLASVSCGNAPAVIRCIDQRCAPDLR